MNIASAEFVKGIIGTDSILKEKHPHVAFVGRSNVGKSSVINSLVMRKDLVKSSSMPGKTREINFFFINKKCYFVDLPGYGFARMGAKGAEKIRKLILWYLGSGEARAQLVVLIVDSAVKPMAYDKEMSDILRAENIPFVVVANKIDRLNQTERSHNIKAIEASLGALVLPYSARTHYGREELLETISKAIK
ncbi:MAG: ribosome biogenesis GTP-binding protein YsxC [Candidatus Yonathbacteria bacterium RIFCSPHIGHO2_01_FULL_44_41]|uniref:Probable GTP-binding protein EngB n=1 Tax=Candidatus Yonathbacteria bacterium RIFCSPHIGHO2_02_FULL_44_14 TaxID=1802724 RepID=A0A1G2S7Q3_9BACT|nr:MAG: ribosome biogenesis GTP-binding protein YsxC [Candidatus Yonathbacteria bacterium RIFCSPHIGHO2_01_FULL_44_41]OHA81086.1 MAG: ribosome biogenesis GTP-binding protein YsxC [Candidatus Yonathbacteria bacterium RIFCSPHIGHO2_02_FULL_44_14]OHA81309.1 MAG: ribosome biogenesis GTP-binding protein YsxC [Candidatus Yonathbacteria bacterium RIFCSPLOWO2_01_FULL_43_20]